MKIYHYDENGFFTVETDARLDPAAALRGKTQYLVPRNATAIPVGESRPGFRWKFIEAESSWIEEEILEDTFSLEIGKDFVESALLAEFEAAGMLGTIVDGIVTVQKLSTPENKAIAETTIANHDFVAASKAARIKEIKARLKALDEKAIRPLRAVTTGVGTEEDNTMLVDIENETQALRLELVGLG